VQNEPFGRQLVAALARNTPPFTAEPSSEKASPTFWTAVAQALQRSGEPFTSQPPTSLDASRETPPPRTFKDMRRADLVKAKLFRADLNRADLSLADLVRMTGIPHPTARRLAMELVEAGALERREDGRFTVGLRLWRLGTLAPLTESLRTLAQPFMEDLHSALHQHLQLAVLDGHEAVIIERLSAPPVSLDADQLRGIGLVVAALERERQLLLLEGAPLSRLAL
jgi:DNA-binding transcriptional ArsR family regulator